MYIFFIQFFEIYYKERLLCNLVKRNFKKIKLYLLLINYFFTWRIFLIIKKIKNRAIDRFI